MDSLDKLRDMIYELVEQMDENELKALLELARIIISDEEGIDDMSVADADEFIDSPTKAPKTDRVIWKKIIWSEKIKKIKG